MPTPRPTPARTSKRLSRSIRGASMVETALFLPLILLSVFIIIAVGVALNARAALSSGMTEALRLAHTRGNSTRMGTDILPAIESVHIGNPSESALRILTSLPDNERLSGYYLLDSCFARMYDNELPGLKNQHLYSLVYLNQALAQSIGPSFRFPCLPPGATPPQGCDNGRPRLPGCAMCYLFDPEYPEAETASSSLSPDRIAIRCEYAPSSIFLDPIVRLLSVFGLENSAGGIFTIRRERLFDAQELGL